MIQWDKFYPTVYETELAKKVFLKSLEENYLDYVNGDMSAKTVISIAIAEVWTAGKKYQDKHNRALKGANNNGLLTTNNGYCERN